MLGRLTQSAVKKSNRLKLRTSECTWEPAASKKSGTGKSSDVTCSTTEADKDGKKQMVIDAGQKVIGAVNCNTCDFVYTAGKFNKTFGRILKPRRQ